MSDEWGFAISCRRCGSPATVTNPPWRGAKGPEGAPAANVEISCSNSACDQPTEQGGVSWWSTTCVPSLLFSDSPMMLGGPAASRGTCVVMTYSADGKRDDRHYGSAGRGRSRFMESLGHPRSEEPLDDITYEFVDSEEAKLEHST